MKVVQFVSLSLVTLLVIHTQCMASSQRPEAASNPIVQQFLRRAGPASKISRAQQRGGARLVVRSIFL